MTDVGIGGTGGMSSLEVAEWSRDGAGSTDMIGEGGIVDDGVGLGARDVW